MCACRAMSRRSGRVSPASDRHSRLLFLALAVHGRRRIVFPPSHREPRMTRGQRIYAPDPNVLMHDPTALFRFEEHDVFLPMTVLEELDAAKKGTSETARNARQVSRFINELIEHGNGKHIDQGLELKLPQGIQLGRNGHSGRLYFQT